MFYDRSDAGEKLAKSLQNLQKEGSLIITAIPRGGVVIAKNIIKELPNSVLDVILVKKIGAPENHEYAIGAICQECEPVLNDEIIGTQGITPDYLDQEIVKLKDQIAEQHTLYKTGLSNLDYQNKTIILVDDGAATGLSLKAAVQCIKNKEPAKIILALPVAPSELVDELSKLVDQLICLEKSDNFFAVGQFYDQFDQVDDNEVLKILLECKK